MTEKVLSVIPNVSKPKGNGIEAFNLVLTSERIIAAQVINKSVQQTEQPKDSGAFIYQLFNTASAGYTLYKKYYAMKPDEIAAENAGNIILPHSQITAVDLKEGILEGDERGPSEIVIHYTGQLNFLFSEGNSITFQEARKAFKDLLGDKVR